MTVPKLVEEMIGVSDKMAENIKKSAVTSTSAFGDSHLDLVVIDALSQGMKDSKKSEAISVLDEAIWDMFSSIYLAASGLYRTSFMALRSALELGLAFVYFHDHNYLYLLWKKNLYDFQWSKLGDPQEGVITKSYLKFFCERLEDSKAEDICNEIKELYRICSEYVHGKFVYMHTIKNGEIQFSSMDLEKWHDVFRRVACILIVIILLRFNTVCIEGSLESHMKDMLSKFSEVIPSE